MSGARSIYVDTNIFIIAFEGKGELSEALSERLLRSGRLVSGIVTSVLTYAELMAGAYRDADEALLRFYRSMFGSGDLDIVPIDLRLLDRAARLRAAYRVLKLADAIHVAAAIEARCDHLISHETRFPSAFTLDASTIDVIRPDVAGLAILGELAAR